MGKLGTESFLKHLNLYVIEVEINFENKKEVEDEKMNNYIDDLDLIIDSVVDIVKELEDGEGAANIGEVIKKCKAKGISNSHTLLRDAIMAAGGKGELKIRKSPPNQLRVNTS